MFKDTKERFMEKLQEWKDNPRIVRLVKILLLSIVVVIAYSIICALQISGVIGLILRAACLLILLYILRSLYKKK